MPVTADACQSNVEPAQNKAQKRDQKIITFDSLRTVRYVVDVRSSSICILAWLNFHRRKEKLGSS